MKVRWITPFYYSVILDFTSANRIGNKNWVPHLDFLYGGRKKIPPLWTLKNKLKAIPFPLERKDFYEVWPFSQRSQKPAFHLLIKSPHFLHVSSSLAHSERNIRWPSLYHSSCGSRVKLTIYLFFLTLCLKTEVSVPSQFEIERQIYTMKIKLILHSCHLGSLHSLKRHGHYSKQFLEVYSGYCLYKKVRLSDTAPYTVVDCIVFWLKTIHNIIIHLTANHFWFEKNGVHSPKTKICYHWGELKEYTVIPQYLQGIGSKIPKDTITC